MSWFRSSQRKSPQAPSTPPPAAASEPAEEEEALERAGAAEREPEPEQSSPPSNAPLDFFSLDPLDDDWDDEEEEEEEAAAVAEAPVPARRRGRSGAARRRRPGKALEDRPLADLHQLARDAGVAGYRLLRRSELIAKLQEEGADAATPAPDDTPAPLRRDSARERSGRRRGGRGRGGRERRPASDRAPTRGAEDRSAVEHAARPDREEAPAERLEGMLELMADGFGFLRVEAPLRSSRDPHLSREQIERYGLRPGDRVVATARPARRAERNPSAVEVVEVEGRPAVAGASRAEDFTKLPALPPAERLPLAAQTTGIRMLEVVTPLGRGHRVLVHGPAGAGATRLLQDVSAALSDAPVHVLAAVVDARPEELGSWRSCGAELLATSAEDAPADQVRGATLGLERAKRLVEDGTEVVLLVDSLTRLARAHTAAADRRGGPGSAPVHELKRLFAAARSTGRGSLTIIAAARTDDEGTADSELRESLAQIANVEVHLDSALADAGLFPAIDVRASRTRGEDALVDADERAQLDALRGPARELDGDAAWRYLAEQLESG